MTSFTTDRPVLRGDPHAPHRPPTLAAVRQKVILRLPTVNLRDHTIFSTGLGTALRLAAPKVVMLPKPRTAGGERVVNGAPGRKGVVMECS